MSPIEYLCQPVDSLVFSRFVLLAAFILDHYIAAMSSPCPLDQPLSSAIRSNIWFEDGNIVLIVGSSVAFKVHRGQLERHSEVFHDIFSIPQPQDQRLIDGCPFVELHDCPSDVFYLLTALYDGLYVCHNTSI